jgi:hypothetical protein
MRALAVIALTSAGCFGHGSAAAGELAVAAIGGIFEIGQAIAEAEAEKRAYEEAQPKTPPPSGIRDYWKGRELACAPGRTMHLVCVRAVTGRSCFWETSEGTPFDCPDASCKTIPAELARWCNTEPSIFELSRSEPFQCTRGRSYIRHCLRGPNGDHVEYVDSDGSRYECAERSCMKTPPALEAWCSY